MKIFAAVQAVTYKWLPVVFGCHTRPDRSFFWKGRQFPLCARCTGELVGGLFAILIFQMGHPPLWGLVLGMLPLLIDGYVQLKTSYESTNPRRLITGLLFGYCVITFALTVAFNLFSGTGSCSVLMG